MIANSEILNSINSIDDIKKLSYDELNKLAREVRELIIDRTSKNFLTSWVYSYKLNVSL